MVNVARNFDKSKLIKKQCPNRKDDFLKEFLSNPKISEQWTCKRWDYSCQQQNIFIYPMQCTLS